MNLVLKLWKFNVRISAITIEIAKQNARLLTRRNNFRDYLIFKHPKQIFLVDYIQALEEWLNKVIDNE